MLTWKLKETLKSALQGLCLPSKLGQGHAGMEVHYINSYKMLL